MCLSAVSFLEEFLGPFMHKIISLKVRILRVLHALFVPPLSLSLTVLAEASATALKRNRESGHPCLVPDL